MSTTPPSPSSNPQSRPLKPHFLYPRGWDPIQVLSIAQQLAWPILIPGKHNILRLSAVSTHLFFSQKMDAKDPEKKMPSTAAKAITRSPKVAFS